MFSFERMGTRIWCATSVTATETASSVEFPPTITTTLTRKTVMFRTQIEFSRTKFPVFSGSNIILSVNFINLISFSRSGVNLCFVEAESLLDTNPVTTTPSTSTTPEPNACDQNQCDATSTICTPDGSEYTCKCKSGFQAIYGNDFACAGT